MLQLLNASMYGFIDLCNAIYHNSKVENMMHLAQDILNIHVVRMLPTTTQQATIDNYISSFKPQWCIVCTNYNS